MELSSLLRSRSLASLRRSPVRERRSQAEGLGMSHAPSAGQRFGSRIFQAVHRRNLVYNTCWEDPALDREALDFRADDRVAVITSAGCNALDYLLAGAGEVNAVDINPIQNALVELKVAALCGLDYESFFDLFGRGRSPHARAMYHDALRDRLSDEARVYWDKNIGMFAGRGWQHSFYYRGTSGLIAKLVLTNARVLHRMHDEIEDLLNASTVEEQRALYESRMSRPPVDSVAALVPVAHADADAGRRALATARPDRPPIPGRRVPLHPRRLRGRRLRTALP